MPFEEELSAAFFLVSCHTHVHLAIDYVDEAAEHDDKVEHVPRVAKVVLLLSTLVKRGKARGVSQEIEGERGEICE